MVNESSFSLKGNVAFNDRQKSIFGMLDKITPVKTNQRYSEEDFKKSEAKVIVSSTKKELKQFMGQESIFKKPETPMKRSFKMTIPDFVKNPHKWKKYKMGEEIMTEKSNTAVAMSFLREMKERVEPMDSDKPPNDGPVIFNKHAKLEGEKLAMEVKEAPTFINGKRVMPEYVVGQKVKKTVTFKKPELSEKPTSFVKLGHLYNEEEE